MVRYLPAKARLALVKSVLGPSGAWWLRDRVEGHVDIRVGRGGAVRGRRSRAEVPGSRRATRTDGGDALEVDHVLAATGYRVGLDALGFLSDDAAGVAADASPGSPLLDALVRVVGPGPVLLAGSPPRATFGPLLRFVHGADFAARRIGAAVPAPAPGGRGLNLAHRVTRRAGGPAPPAAPTARTVATTNGSGSSAREPAPARPGRARAARRRPRLRARRYATARRRVEDLHREAAADDRLARGDRRGR